MGLFLFILGFSYVFIVSQILKKLKQLASDLPSDTGAVTEEIIFACMAMMLPLVFTGMILDAVLSLFKRKENK